jgi:hypothetical protein
MKIAKTMKKAVCALAASGMFLLCGFDSATFELDDLKDYQREFQSESIGTCSSSSVKTYEDYRGISNTGSKQYRYIHDHMTVDDTTGFLLMDEDGFIGVAMGYQYGDIGSAATTSCWIPDIIIPVVKVDAKASAGCAGRLQRQRRCERHRIRDRLPTSAGRLLRPGTARAWSAHGQLQ